VRVAAQIAQSERNKAQLQVQETIAPVYLGRIDEAFLESEEAVGVDRGGE
jgi:hypothetical protein